MRFPVLEGDKVIKEVDKGGKNVHPVPPPNSEFMEWSRKRYESKRTKVEKYLQDIRLLETLDRYNIISKSSKQARHY